MLTHTYLACLKNSLPSIRGEVAAPGRPAPPPPAAADLAVPACGGDEKRGPIMPAAAARPLAVLLPLPAAVGPAVLAAGMPDLLASTASLAAVEDDRMLR